MALQQAIDTTAGQSTLRMPAGTSVISQTITIPSYARIAGAGATYLSGGELAGSWWQWPSLSSAGSSPTAIVAIGSEGQTSIVQDVVLEDFGIAGPDTVVAGSMALIITSNPGSGGKADPQGATTNIRGRGLMFGLVENVMVVGYTGALTSGQVGGQADYLRFEQCVAYDFTGVGILINDDNGADTSLFSGWSLFAGASLAGVEIGVNGCGNVEFDCMTYGGPVGSFMYNINQSSAADVIIRNSEQENAAFLNVTGNSDASTISLLSNTVNAPGPATAGATPAPTIVISGINRVVGIGNEIMGTIALNSTDARYVGIMDRFVHIPAGASAPAVLTTTSTQAALANLDLMHFDPYDFVDATSGGLLNITGSPAGQVTLEPGNSHPELTRIAADVCTRSGGRCQPWPGAGQRVAPTQLYMPSVDNTYQYYSLDGGKTGTTEPDWPTTYLATVTDGSVTWVNAGQAGEFRGFGPLDHYKQTAAPTSGYYRQGAVVWNATPAVGGYVGWVCTESGNPGTWIGFGAIG
jgi:hypothetical protein